VRGDDHLRVAVPLALALLLVAALVVLVGARAVDAATNWAVHVASTNSGEAHAQVLPAAPASPAASCAAPTTSKTIKVTWSAVTHATTYSVFEATTSATGTYSSVATGVTTTSWTSGTLTAGTNYWFEVTALIGTNWTSVKSAATGESTINSSNPFCIQP